MLYKINECTPRDVKEICHVLSPTGISIETRKSFKLRVPTIARSTRNANSIWRPTRVGTISDALSQIQEWARRGQWEQKIASVLDLLDTQLDPREVEKARDVQMATLVEKPFATPKLKSAIPRKCKLFNFKWVNEIKRGAYRSRFTCADIKKRYSKEEPAAV